MNEQVTQSGSPLRNMIKVCESKSEAERESPNKCGCAYVSAAC